MTVAEAAAASYRQPSTEPLPIHIEAIHGTIGAINFELGRLDIAKIQMERSVQLARSSRRWYEESKLLNSLAELHERRGEDATADLYAGEALDRLQGVRSPTVSFSCLALRARVADRAGRTEEATALAHQGLARLPEGHPRGDQLRELIESLTS